ncbi:hypothetical protein [Photobacterium damselae]|uniref:hypothetical protein n=1 Tax=Photobacterium damselae TaxID=38293 RepID=UPI004068FFD5
MKFKSLLVILSSIISINTSAAVLDVHGEIKVDGSTALKTINMDTFDMTTGTYNYTSERCIYNSNGVEDCGTFTRVLTYTESDGQTIEEEIIKDHHGDLQSKIYSIESGNQKEISFTSYNKGYDSEYVQPHWINSNGEIIVHDGQPVYEGMIIGNNCDDQNICQPVYWAPKDSDKYIDGHQKYTPNVSISKHVRKFEFKSILDTLDKAILGVPNTVIISILGGTDYNESWTEYEDGTKKNYFEKETIIKPHSDISVRTPVQVLDKFEDFNNCLVIFDGDRTVRCQGYGTVIQGYSASQIWTLVR